MSSKYSAMCRSASSCTVADSAAARAMSLSSMSVKFWTYRTL